MAETAPIHLRSQVPEEPDKRSIPFLISRLIDQKGGFRNVTEESLKAQIRDGTAASSSSGDDAESSEEDLEEEKSRPEQLAVAKTKLVQFAMEAYNESATALDMISLLVSKNLPAQGESSLSPFLKSTLPLGSLGAEPVQATPPTASKSQDDKAVSFGWKLQSLNNAADSLLKSATRLEEEMRREAEYWEQAMSIRDKGWAVCRLPRERHTLGVRYGFLESAPEFRDKSMAALRLSDSGGLELDLGPGATLSSQRIRARVLRKGRTIAVSPNDTLPLPPDESMESSILAARNGLFDSELYHEIYKEGRSLTNRGVKCLSEGVSLPLEDDKTILVELLEDDEPEPEIAAGDESKAYDKLPELVIVALRILLCHAHRQRYNHRAKPPPPLTARKEQRIATPILLPILSHLQHRSAFRSLRSFLGGLAAIFSAAGLELGLGYPVDDFGLSGFTSLGKAHGTPLVEALVQTLCNTLASNTEVISPSKAITFTVGVRTHSMGTEFTVAKELGATRVELEEDNREESFTSLMAAEEYLCHFLAVDLLLEIEKSNSKWLVESPHSGTLSTEQTMDGDYHALSIKLDRDRLALDWSASSGGGPREESLVWGHGDGDGKPGNGFMDAVARFNRRIASLGSKP